MQPAPASAVGRAARARGRRRRALRRRGGRSTRRARRSMEARFGYDFSGVRVHDDARAAATAASIDAAAFTVGEDLVFAPGRYDPSSDEGRRLLAHELAHVVQQGEAAGRPATSRARTAARPEAARVLRAAARRRPLRVRPRDAGAAAAESAKRSRARAYTVGSAPRLRPQASTSRRRSAAAGSSRTSSHTSRRRADGERRRRHAGRRARRERRRDGGRARASRRASSARRDAASTLHKFGEPDNTPDLTFVSTSGEPGFLRPGDRVPPDVGPRAAVVQLDAGRCSPRSQPAPARSAGCGSSATRTPTTSSRRSSTAARPGSPSTTCLPWGDSDVAGLRPTLVGAARHADAPAAVEHHHERAGRATPRSSRRSASTRRTRRRRARSASSSTRASTS